MSTPNNPPPCVKQRNKNERNPNYARITRKLFDDDPNTDPNQNDTSTSWLTEQMSDLSLYNNKWIVIN